MRVLTYTPHGAIPDKRGFSPALVASYFSQYLSPHESIHVCAAEGEDKTFEIHPKYGQIYRLKQSKWYQTLFCKWTRLDPLPLHARLAKIVQKVKPDVIHVHQLEFPVTDFRNRIKSDIPIVVHAHAVRTYQKSWGYADQYIAVSEFTKRQLILRGFPEARISVIHNGTNTNLFVPIEPKLKHSLMANWQIPREAFVVAYVGRKQESKGYFTYLQALSELCLRHPHVIGICAGPTPPEAENDVHHHQAMQLSKQLIALGKLIDHPALPHEKLVQVFQLTDALLFPSCFSGEQHPLVLIEAMSTGCVVFTTQTAGIMETVIPGVNAITLPDAQDWRTWVESVQDQILHSNQYDSIANNARLTAMQYDWQVLAKQVQRLYSNLLMNVRR